MNDNHSALSNRKILLTSAGFENRAIAATFLNLVGKPPSDIKALFIPAAAINYDALLMVPKCMEDLLNCGVLAENIEVFDLHRAKTEEEMAAFDAVYFTGGDPRYLLERINATGFDTVLKTFVDNGGVYVGVSAGSWVAAGNLPNNLGFLSAVINVHMETGGEAGIFDNEAVTKIDLTNEQAVLIRGEVYEII